MEEYYYSNEGVLKEVIYSNYNVDLEEYEFKSKEILKSDLNFSKEQMFTPFAKDDEESERTENLRT